MNKLYVAKTYLVDSNFLKDERITAISSDIDMIKIYTNRIRGIPIVSYESDIPDMYESICKLQEARFQSYEDMQHFLSVYEDFVMVDYGEVDRNITGLTKKESKHIQLPKIVIDIIDKKVDQFKTELTMANHTLKELLFYINGFDKNKSKVSLDSINLMKTCKLLERLTSESGYELSDDMYNRSPILFCSEREYRNYIDMEIAHRELDEAYRQAITDMD